MALTAAARQQRDVLEREWACWGPALRVAGPQSAGRHGSAHPAGVRPAGAESWTRSLRWADPGQVSAPSSEDGMVAARWSDSPLRAADSQRQHRFIKQGETT